MSQYIGVGRLGLSQDVTFSATHGENSTPFAAGTYKVRVAGGSIDCRIRIGKSAVAVTTDTFLPLGSVEYFTAYPGEVLSAVGASAGTINVTEIS